MGKILQIMQNYAQCIRPTGRVRYAILSSVEWLAGTTSPNLWNVTKAAATTTTKNHYHRHR